MRRIDLHAHTIYSDGSLTPTALVERAHGLGLCALAVTDHDTTAGLPEARAAGSRLGLEILDGCEITASNPSGIVHILAYGFPLADAGLQGLLATVRAGRDERNERILAKLAALRVPVTLEEVRAFAHGRIVARPHIAQALVERGHVEDLREAFQRYLNDRGPAYVPAVVPTAEEAIAATAAAGGVSVLAHPRSLRLGNRRAWAETFERFRDAGLVGVEVDHPSHDASQRALFGELAAELDLVASGGSDFHGEAKPHLELGVGDGTIEVPYATWARLRARRPGAAA